MENNKAIPFFSGDFFGSDFFAYFSDRRRRDERDARGEAAWSGTLEYNNTYPAS
ncbi:hypothetical protein D3C73_842960 [compost metagenome]